MLTPPRLARFTPVSVLIIAASFLLAPRSTLSQGTGTNAASEMIKQGNADLASQHYQDAIKAFKSANKEQHGACADCYLGLAIGQAHLGEFDEALKNCDKALSSARDDHVRIISYTFKGNLLQKVSEGNSKKMKEAESEYRSALHLDGSNAMSHFDLGLVLLRESERTEGLRELDAYLQLAPSGENASYAKKLIAYPQEAGEDLAPGFKVQTLDGKEVSLDALNGKIVVMDFWATWCPPCVESVPELKALTKKFPGSKLALISISADVNEQPWRDFIAKNNMDWPQYWDSDGRIRNEFGVHAFPTYLVIDQEGFVHDRIIGLNPQQSVVSRLKDTLNSMLPE